MPTTTTFCDIEMTEKVEKYRYENEDYTWEEGDVVSLPQHTANRFVNQWGKAKWAKEPYEIRDEDYDEVVGRVRDNGDSKGEKPKDIPEDFDSVEDSITPTEWLEMRNLEQIEKDLEEDFESNEADIGFLKQTSSAADRKGAKELLNSRIEELEE